jgi:hypothetical protein
VKQSAERVLRDDAERPQDDEDDDERDHGSSETSISILRFFCAASRLRLEMSTIITPMVRRDARWPRKARGFSLSASLNSATDDAADVVPSG